jgi:KipI family sensor histidine kinase inhibitor
MRLLPYGDRAILVELADFAARRRLDAALRRTPVDGIVEHVPGAVTVLVRVAEAGCLERVAAALRTLPLEGQAPEESSAAARVVEIGVRYDGADLAEVAGHLSMSVEEVVARHVGQTWTVEFSGFAPGFGYLVGEQGGLDVPRRDSPRTRIPTGAVALAGPFTGVYPRPSPGGWQLIGSTEERMWDEARQPPALFTPGARVRFVEVSGG